MGDTLSPINNSSYSFSPGRNPVKVISISPSGFSSSLTSKPASRIIRLAMSAIFTGSPISSTNTSPPWPIEPAWITNCAASGMVMKYRIIFGSVTVTGPPLLIWLLNNGTTEPEEPRTLPKRTIVNRVPVSFCFDRTCRIISAKRFEAPIVLVGRTALSVEINTNVSTWEAIAALATR